MVPLTYLWILTTRALYCVCSCRSYVLPFYRRASPPGSFSIAFDFDSYRVPPVYAHTPLPVPLPPYETRSLYSLRAMPLPVYSSSTVLHTAHTCGGFMDTVTHGVLYMHCYYHLSNTCPGPRRLPTTAFPCLPAWSICLTLQRLAVLVGGACCTAPDASRYLNRFCRFIASYWDTHAAFPATTPLCYTCLEVCIPHPTPHSPCPSSTPTTGGGGCYLVPACPQGS